jgi:pimeloyl-ACP methyl ester carboxylesterase
VAVPEPAPKRAAGLLFVHGLRSSQSSYIARAELVAAQAEVVCLAFDLAGHGTSGGVLAELRPRDHLADISVAYDYLAGLEQVDGDRIGLCGASYGGYLAALFVAERPVKRLLLRAPAVYADDAVELPIGEWHGAQPGRPAAVAFERLHAFPGDVLVVESELDTVIPRSLIDRYTASSPRAQRTVIHGAGHALEPKFEKAFVEIVCTWFRGL